MKNACTKIFAFPKPTRDKLIEDHMHLVPVIARKVKAKLPPSFEFDDLVSEGYIGLIDAADHWEPERGPFEPRARYKILMTMLESVRRKRYTANTLVSLNQPVGSQNGNACPDRTLLDVFADGHILNLPKSQQENDRITSIDTGRRKAMLRGAVQQIAARARRVVEIYYFEQQDMTVAAAELGVQASRASQIHQDGLRQLTTELTKRGVVIEYETLRKRTDIQRQRKVA